MSPPPALILLRARGCLGKLMGPWSGTGLGSTGQLCAGQHMRPRGHPKDGGCGEMGKALWGWVGDERGVGGWVEGHVVSHLEGKVT